MPEFAVGDDVIILSDETPKQNRERLGLLAKPEKHKRNQKVAHFDQIEKVGDVAGPKQIKTKKYKFRNFPQRSPNHQFTPDESDGVIRMIYFADKDWFKLPAGLQATVDEVYLDDAFIERILKPYDIERREA